MIDAKRFGLAAGIVWGACMALTVLIALFYPYGEPFLFIMASVYPGFDISPLGVIIGGIYGFVDGFIGFFLIGWLYNRLG